MNQPLDYFFNFLEFFGKNILKPLGFVIGILIAIIATIGFFDTLITQIFFSPLFWGDFILRLFITFYLAVSLGLIIVHLEWNEVKKMEKNLENKSNKAQLL